MGRQLLRTLAVALVVFGLDRLTKILVVEQLDLRNQGYIPVFEPYLAFTMAWNEGVNFGLFDFGQAGRWVLVGLALGISGALLVWVRRTRRWSQALGAGLLIGGAIGNVYDRLTYGAVADFLNMSCCGVRNPFAFNVADAAIFLGAVLLIVVQPEKR